MGRATSDAMCGALRIPCRPTDKVGYGFHKHQCPKCGETWAHDDDLPSAGLSPEEFDFAHSCPKCGTRQFEKREKYLDEELVIFALNRLFGLEEAP